MLLEQSFSLYVNDPGLAVHVRHEEEATFLCIEFEQGLPVFASCAKASAIESWAKANGVPR